MRQWLPDLVSIGPDFRSTYVRDLYIVCAVYYH